MTLIDTLIHAAKTEQRLMDILKLSITKENSTRLRTAQRKTRSLHTELTKLLKQ